MKLNTLIEKYTNQLTSRLKERENIAEQYRGKIDFEIKLLQDVIYDLLALQVDEQEQIAEVLRGIKKEPSWEYISKDALIDKFAKQLNMDLEAKND